MIDTNLDLYDDKGFSYLMKLAEEKKIPDFIKDEKMLTGKELELLPNSDFALVIQDAKGNYHRKFPVSDRPNTWLSMFYYGKNRDKLEPRCRYIASHMLCKAIQGDPQRHHPSLADSWSKLHEDKKLFNFPVKHNLHKELGDREKFPEKIERAVEEVKTSRAKIASSQFALVFSKEGSTYRLFPIRDEGEVQKAASYFDKNYRIFPLEQRNKFAMAVRDRAKELNVKVASSELCKYASFDWAPGVELAIKGRRDRVAEEYKEGFGKLASLVGKIEIDKFAGLLHEIDTTAGLDKCYGKTLYNAYESTYDKLAFHSDHNRGSTGGGSGAIHYAGKSIDPHAIVNMDFGDLGGMIDSDTLEDLKSDPVNVFNSLPLPYKDAICQLLAR